MVQRSPLMCPLRCPLRSVRTLWLESRRHRCRPALGSLSAAPPLHKPRRLDGPSPISKIPSPLGGSAYRDICIPRLDPAMFEELSPSNQHTLAHIRSVEKRPRQQQHHPSVWRHDSQILHSGSLPNLRKYGICLRSGKDPSEISPKFPSAHRRCTVWNRTTHTR